MAHQMNSKKVLMFCADFFGYDKRIRGALENDGYEVDLFEERAGTGFFAKVFTRLHFKPYRFRIRRYVTEVIQRAGDDYDYVFVVKGESLDQDCIRQLREAYPRAKFILYLWDSVANVPQCAERMKYYDRVLTFDPADAAKYSIPQLSLPYDASDVQYQSREAHEFDVAFIGTVHSQRPRIVKEVERRCLEMGKRCFVYFYSPHPLVYLFSKLTNPDFRYITRKEVHFKPLSPNLVRSVYQRTLAVLDIEHPGQKGTTTRPVEMLPMKKKVITTNAAVKNFPFYHKNNFLVIDREKVQLDPTFFDLPYLPVADTILKQYSPHQFVKTLFSDV